jgi:glyoxylase-like metal-dependent hydrolase (beta-lactamase superfamily II)
MNQGALYKTALALLFATLLGCTGTQAKPTPTLLLKPGERLDVNEDLYVRQIREGAFVVTHAFPWPANSLLVEMENSALVLVDTPYTPQATQDLLDWLEAQFGEREIVVINTGFHYDNLGGNGYLVQQGIPVYGADLTARLLQERGEEMRAMTLAWLQDPQQQRYRQAYESLQYVAPTQQFELEEGLELEFGDEALQIHFPGPGQRPDNLVVYFPARKILFGGCMIIGWDSVGNTADADLQAWPQSVRNLPRFDFDVLVPGHGDRLDPELIEHTLSLLAELE